MVSPLSTAKVAMGAPRSGLDPAVIVPSAQGSTMGTTSTRPGVTTARTHKRRIAFCTAGSDGNGERSNRA
jgi:hypothetical protein